MNKKFLCIGLLLTGQIAGLYAAQVDGGTFISTQYFSEAVKDLTGLVVGSDAPFNSGRTPGFNAQAAAEFQANRKLIAISASIQAKFYNTPTPGPITECFTKDPLNGVSFDEGIQEKTVDKEENGKIKLNKCDELFALLEKKYPNAPWLGKVKNNIIQYRNTLQKYIKKSVSELAGKKPDVKYARQWREDIRRECGISKENFANLTHEHVMDMFEIPKDKWAEIKADVDCERAIVWNSKMPYTYGFGGSSADMINYCVYVAGMEPEDVRKKSVAELASIIDGVHTRILDGTLTPEEQQRADALLYHRHDAEKDDMNTSRLMWLATGRVKTSAFVEQPCIDELEKQGYKAGQVSEVVEGVTLESVLVKNSQNTGKALACLKKRPVKDWFTKPERPLFRVAQQHVRNGFEKAKACLNTAK